MKPPPGLGSPVGDHDRVSLGYSTTVFPILCPLPSFTDQETLGDRRVVALDMVAACVGTDAACTKENATSLSIENSTNPQIELIFLGTGVSSSVPYLDCLTAPPTRKPCRTCLSTLTPEGKKNIRRNTSAVVRVAGENGKKRWVSLRWLDPRGLSGE